MHPGSRWALGMLIGLSMAAGEAQAQFYGGYGGYGWGGWGGGTASAPGNMARGLGYYNMGAGAYNEDTAQANAVNADTLARWNQYMYESQQLANRRAYLRRARKVKRDAQSGDEVYQRIRDNPTAEDIRDGDALNAILDQITNPKVHSTALRLIRNPVSGKTVREIPFVNASEAVTISLHQLSGEGTWPVALQGETFAPERKAYQDAIARALEEGEEGSLSPQVLQGVNAATSRLRAKLDANKPGDRIQYNDAMNYIKTLTAMSRMLAKPQVDKILAELDTVKETSLGSLLAFMHAYNLQFGPATNDAQGAVYASLYPIMAEARDRIMKDMGDDAVGGDKPMARDNQRHPVDFFQGLHLEELDRGSGDDRPKR